MSLTTAIVLYPLLWFICLFFFLPQRVQTQGERGEIVPGTPQSAPFKAQFKSKVIRTTIATTVVWGVICLSIIILLSMGVGIQDIDFFNRWGDGQYG